MRSRNILFSLLRDVSTLGNKEEPGQESDEKREPKNKDTGTTAMGRSSFLQSL